MLQAVENIYGTGGLWGFLQMPFGDYGPQDIPWPVIPIQISKQYYAMMQVSFFVVAGLWLSLSVCPSSLFSVPFAVAFSFHHAFCHCLCIWVAFANGLNKTCTANRCATNSPSGLVTAGTPNLEAVCLGCVCLIL